MEWKGKAACLPPVSGEGAGVGLLKLAMACHIIALKDAYCERGLSDCNNVKTYY